MKKLVPLLIGIFGFMFTAQAQYLPVSGLVTELNTNVAVPNHTVYIVPDSTSGPVFTPFSTQTDASGHFYFSISYLVPQMLVHVYTYDCNGLLHNVNVTLSNVPSIVNFQICNSPVPPCNAQYIFSADSANAYNIHFQSFTSNPGSNYTAQWTFGDGTASTGINTSHVYQYSGVYYACLTISDANSSCTSTFCDTVDVIAPSTCHSSFTYTASNLISNSVNFTYTGSTNTGTQYYWDFGDGATSNAQNPSHQYANGNQSYQVCLIITDGNCTNTYCHEVVIGTPPCNVSFNWLNSPTDSSGYTYQFIPSPSNPSSAIVTWTFANGISVTQYSPSYTFPGPGTYNVCMNYSIPGTTCSGTLCQNVVIDSAANIPCNAFYTYSVNGSVVHFNYAGSSSTGNQYIWNFGDGSPSSPDQNPTHTYSNTSGIYTVCLTLYNGNCQDSYCDSIIFGTPGTTYHIGGQVHIGTTTPADSGFVILYSINTQNAPYVVTQSTTINHDSTGNAFYYFPNLTNGYYLVQAFLNPGSQYYATTLPTYHLSSVDWSTADLITINGASQGAAINMILGTNTGGNGSIFGTVIQGGSKGLGDPISGVEILLENASGTPIKHAVSLSNGTYSFSNLAFGTYKVIAEIAGVSCTAYNITLSSAQPSVSGVSVTLNSNNAVISRIQENENLNSTGQVYPNPSNGDAYIDLFGTEKMKVSISNVNGIILSTNEYSINGSKRVELKTHNLPIGVYSICIENSHQNKIFRKLVISK